MLSSWALQGNWWNRKERKGETPLKKKGKKRGPKRSIVEMEKSPGGGKEKDNRRGGAASFLRAVGGPSIKREVHRFFMGLEGERKPPGQEKGEPERAEKKRTLLREQIQGGEKGQSRGGWETDQKGGNAFFLEPLEGEEIGR